MTLTPTPSTAAALRRRAATLLAACALAGAAHADDRATPRAPPLPLYTQECGACHLAYPPGLLPAASWKRLMDTSPRHYGADASMDAATRQQVADWLAANAGTTKRVREAPPDDRISRSAWFIRKHDELPATTWQRPAIKSAANCQACHPRADQGAFNERDIQIPR